MHAYTHTQTPCTESHPVLFPAIQTLVEVSLYVCMYVQPRQALQF